MVSEIAEQVLRFMRSLPAEGEEARSLEEQRAQSEIVWPLLTGDVPGSTFEPEHAGGVPAEMVRTPESDPTRVVLYLHGGGYWAGSIATHRKLAAHLCSWTGMTGLVIAYRLAPEHPFPAALDDALASYDWLLGKGFDPSRIVVAGDSAGGGLAVALALRLRDGELPLPRALVLFSPWTDLAMSGDSIVANREVDPVIKIGQGESPAVRAYIGTSGADVRDPLISPLYGDLRGLPRMLVQVGSDEVLLDDSRRLAEAARRAGADVTLETWPGMFHVFQMGAGLLPEADEAMSHVAAWLEQSG